MCIRDRHGVDVGYVDTLLAHNARRYGWVQRQLEGRLLGRDGRAVVAVWGLAYKKNTHSTKNSMALRVIENLRGRAEVRAYDPLVKTPGADVSATVVESRDAALVGADCLLILTDWDEFATPPRTGFRSMRRPLVIDCVGVMDPTRHELPGVEYISMGRARRS